MYQDNRDRRPQLLRPISGDEYRPWAGERKWHRRFWFANVFWGSLVLYLLTRR